MKPREKGVWLCGFWVCIFFPSITLLAAFVLVLVNTRSDLPHSLGGHQ